MFAVSAESCKDCESWVMLVAIDHLTQHDPTLTDTRIKVNPRRGGWTGMNWVWAVFMQFSKWRKSDEFPFVCNLWQMWGCYFGRWCYSWWLQHMWRVKSGHLTLCISEKKHCRLEMSARWIGKNVHSPFHLDTVKSWLESGLGGPGVDRFPEACGSGESDPPNEWLNSGNGSHAAVPTYPPTWNWNSCETSRKYILNQKKWAEGLTQTQMVHS